MPTMCEAASKIDSVAQVIAPRQRMVDAGALTSFTEIERCKEYLCRIAAQGPSSVDIF